MDFFAHQDRARKLSRALLLMYALGVVALVASIDLFISAVFALRFDTPFSPRAHLVTVLALAAIVVTISAHRLWLLRDQQGEALAQMSGARRIVHAGDFAERRLLNVVEEMAVASGVRVPDVYVVDAPGINAFAAGGSVNNAAVFVTRGALDLLNRAELQGVIGHEFSHILHGDMALNMRLLGYLAGIQFFGATGAYLVRGTLRGGGRRSGQLGLALMLFGAGLWLIGCVGVLIARMLQAAVSRQREFLADAASVQFTRNPRGIGGALQKIGSLGFGSALEFRHASELSHLCMADVLPRERSPFATHPPIAERLRRLGQPRLPARAAFDPTGTPQQIAASVQALVSEELRAEYAGAASASDETQASQTAAPAEFAPGAQEPAAHATLVAAVGNPLPQHVQRAHALLHQLPPALLEHLNRVDGAQAALYALFIAEDGALAAAQLRQLTQQHSGSLAADSQRYAAALRRAGALARLPLMDLALPQLRPRALPERESLVRTLRLLIEADARVSLDEFVLQTIIEHDLLERNRAAEAIRFDSVQRVRGAASLVAALVAYAGARAGRNAAQSYQHAENLHRWLGALAQRDEITLPNVKRALEDLRALAPLEKPHLIRAFVAIAQADTHISARELELLRAIGSAIDCPIPALTAQP